MQAYGLQASTNLGRHNQTGNPTIGKDVRTHKESSKECAANQPLPGEKAGDKQYVFIPK
jgi:hypothetical protein